MRRTVLAVWSGAGLVAFACAESGQASPSDGKTEPGVLTTRAPAREAPLLAGKAVFRPECYGLMPEEEGAVVGGNAPRRPMAKPTAGAPPASAPPPVMAPSPPPESAPA